ncbi:MAG: AAA-like domain-containing protein [Cyanobacteria bacterium J06627_8]
MTADEALSLVDVILSRYSLSTLQETVFCGVWAGQTYAEIAERAGYEHSYIRDIGFKLWQMLSEALGQKVTKSNLRAILSRYARIRSLGDRSVSNAIAQATTGLQPSLFVNPVQSTTDDTITSDLEFPGGPVPLNSPLYIERNLIESQLYSEIVKPGNIVRIKGQPQSGKTSLLLRLLAYAKHCGIQTVSISLYKADHEVMKSSNRFLRWLAANISRQLQIPPQLEDYWSLDIGSKVSCTAYFEEYILTQVKAPLLIALDEVNQIFEYANIARDFLPLLRSWYEDAKEFKIWQKVRWVIVHSTDVYVPLHIHQSPFNVGLALPLPNFTAEQSLELARRHQFEWAYEPSAAEYLQPLIEMVGGQPYLIRLAFYYLRQTDIDLPKLLADATLTGGIYRTHLRHLLLLLRSHPELMQIYRTVVLSQGPIELEAIAIYRLENMGLVHSIGNQVQPACELYRQFFSYQLANV